MLKLFTSHPHSIGETYWQHFKFASYFALSLILGGVTCLIHAILPFLFKNTGSNVLFNMMHFYISRMPCTEERMLIVAQKIREKNQQQILNSPNIR